MVEYISHGCSIFQKFRLIGKFIRLSGPTFIPLGLMGNTQNQAAEQNFFCRKKRRQLRKCHFKLGSKTQKPGAGIVFTFRGNKEPAGSFGFYGAKNWNS